MILKSFDSSFQKSHLLLKHSLSLGIVMLKYHCNFKKKDAYLICTIALCLKKHYVNTKKYLNIKLKGVLLTALMPPTCFCRTSRTFSSAVLMDMCSLIKK